MIRNGSVEWQSARQRTPHPNLVPSLYRKVTSDIRGSEGKGGGTRGTRTFQGCTWWDRRVGEELWDGGVVGGVGEDMGLEGDFYSQGKVADISLEGRGLCRNEFLKRGGAMVDKKKRKGPLNSIRVFRCQAIFLFFFPGTRNTTTRQVRSETVCNPHTHTCQKK